MVERVNGKAFLGSTFLKKCLSSPTTPTFLALFVDKLLICGNQFMCSSTNTLRELVFDFNFISVIYFAFVCKD